MGFVTLGLFIVFMLLMSVGTFWTAWTIKKEKAQKAENIRRRQKRADERARYAKPNEQLSMFEKRQDEREEQQEEVVKQSVRVDLPPVDFDSLVGRRRFEIDSRNFYVRDKKGAYLKVSERTEKADPRVIEWKENGKTNKQIKKLIDELNKID